MAAGQGFKTFVTGEVLTAGDVNGYLMQGINVFTNATARDAAITAPAEGQFAFTKDNNSLWYYDGAAWVASGATGDIEGVTAGVGISGGGTSGTVTVTNSMATAITTKGDLVVGTGSGTFQRQAVGANGTVLMADSAEADGVKWATPSGFTSGGNRVATSQSTSSTSFTNLATVQSVTLTTGTKAVVWGSFGVYNGTTGALQSIGIAVSGSTTIAASLTYGGMYRIIGANQDHYYAFAVYFNALTAGSNTFTLQFATSTDSSTFFNRHLVVADMGS
jgi:hypothetical protein